MTARLTGTSSGLIDKVWPLSSLELPRGFSALPTFKLLHPPHASASKRLLTRLTSCHDTERSSLP